MTKKARVGLALGAVACLAFVGFVVFISMLTNEYRRSDRSPWWGPPQNPDSTCSGHAWASKHPDDYPWTLPR